MRFFISALDAYSAIIPCSGSLFPVLNPELGLISVLWSSDVYKSFFIKSIQLSTF